LPKKGIDAVALTRDLAGLEGHPVLRLNRVSPGFSATLRLPGCSLLRPTRETCGGPDWHYTTYRAKLQIGLRFGASSLTRLLGALSQLSSSVWLSSRDPDLSSSRPTLSAPVHVSLRGENLCPALSLELAAYYTGRGTFFFGWAPAKRKAQPGTGLECSSLSALAPRP
jgi:hypothetical protein